MQNNKIDRDRKITIASAYIAMQKFLLDYTVTLSDDDSLAFYSLISAMGFCPYETESSDGGSSWYDYKKLAKLADDGKLSSLTEYISPEVEAQSNLENGVTENDKRDWLNNK